VTELELAERLGAPAAQITPLRAALEAALGNWEEVVGWSQAALALDPDGTDTRGLLARAYVAQGSLEEAQAQYRALLDENPDDIRAQERLGILLALTDPPAAPPYLRSAETPLASALIAALESVGDGDPAYRLALVGQACLAHDEPSLAASALERAVGRRQNYADGHALLGQALDRLARQEEALLHLEEAVRLAPNSSLARSLLGLHHLQAGEPGAARPHLEVAYDLDSDNPLLCLYLARTYADLGQYDAAEVWLKEATRLAPENPAIREAAVRFYLRLGLVHEQQGLEAAQAFVELEPESAVAHDLLGWVHFLAGDAEQAAEHLSEAVELGPSLATAHYHLGRVEAYLGRREEAQLTLTRALDLNTDPALRAEIERALSMLR
jgi:tetratricopeptide (TPR) repeat protein